MEPNWYAIGSAAFTAIRLKMSVASLQQMSAEGNDTPVSGDALVIAREGI